MDLYSLIESGGRVKLEVTTEDLVKFAEKLIEKTKEMYAHTQEQANTDEQWLTAEETAKLCHVSPGTLASWQKSGYLVPSKMGRRRLYAKSDIDNILRQR